MPSIKMPEYQKLLRIAYILNGFYLFPLLFDIAAQLALGLEQIMHPATIMVLYLPTLPFMLALGVTVYVKSGLRSKWGHVIPFFLLSNLYWWAVGGLLYALSWGV